MEINGLPLHVLVVHGAVVFGPLSALAAIIFAVVPRWRYLTRWPAVVLALIATGAIWTAKLSGSDLKEARGLPDQLIGTHQERGDLLAWLMIAFVVAVVAAAWLLGGPSGLVSGRGEQAVRAGWLELALPAALVVLAALVVVYTILTGDAGAKAVWG